VQGKAISVGKFKRVYLAVDLGASGGRVLAGIYDGTNLTIREFHRFSNGPVQVGNRLHWDLLRLWNHIQEGLLAASAQLSRESIAAVGVDTWGLDFGLLGPNDELLGNPYCYRDGRTMGVMDEVFKQVSAEEIFGETGLQFMPFNSLFQLFAWKQSGSPLLAAAENLLLMPDLFHWLMTGEKANEMTNATTTQFYNPRTGRWACSLLEKLGLPTHILGNIVPPGTSLGRLRRNVAEATGLPDTQVILPGTHDTASAVMAVPARKGAAQTDWCYISSGTWSLMGIESPQPIVTDLCRELNFTNEGGVGNTTRILKNITGLWLVQECRRIWKQSGKDVSWDELVALAKKAEPLQSFIAPNDDRFVAPDDMPETIRDYCRQTGQTVPGDQGALVRCVLESLALMYRQVLGLLEQLAGRRLDTVHIVGGGTQNRMLCQLTAEACNRLVLAGPAEATAIGNIMMQMVASGEVDSIEDARTVIRDSFPVEEYLPADPASWDAAFGRFQQLLG
jgi:rhamnulokinase